MGTTKLTLIQGDITKERVDAIVNAANRELSGGGGVDGAIHRAGGKAIAAACSELRNTFAPLATGEAVITTGGDLPAPYVIHTVGPIYQAERKAEQSEQLAACYRNSLALGAERGLRRISFPNISTGVYHFPKGLAARIAIAAVRDYLQQHPEHYDEIRFVCFDSGNHTLYADMLATR